MNYIFQFMATVWTEFFSNLPVPIPNSNLKASGFLLGIFIVDMLIIIVRYILIGELSFGISNIRSGRPVETKSTTVSSKSRNGSKTVTTSTTVSSRRRLKK